MAADVTLFDAETIGSGNRGVRRHDLPGGGKRMVMPSTGVEMTLVNGEVTWADGAVQEARAGKVLRS